MPIVDPRDEYPGLTRKVTMKRSYNAGLGYYIWAWIIVGLLTLEGLILLPTHSLVTTRGGIVVPSVDAPLALVIYSFPLLGIFISPFLLFSGLSHHETWRTVDPGRDWESRIQRRRAGWSIVLALVLAALLPVMSLYNLYWLLLWDSAVDGIGYGWVILPLLIAVATGIMLTVALPGWQKLAGILYTLVLPGLLILFAIQAPHIDRRQMTERRAERVIRGIEAFHERQGFYPRELRYLISWRTPQLPEPLLIYKQGWCYQARDDYYTLGYIYQTNWSDPNLVGVVYKTTGDDPAPGEVCNAEIEVLRLQRYVPYIP
ncbi:MAG TPA: hypothetical protein PKE62_18520 [Anaerolineales bacterium]|nr:hypothetical protein [Anaerolineales bacterium]